MGGQPIPLELPVREAMLAAKFQLHLGEQNSVKNTRMTGKLTYVETESGKHWCTEKTKEKQ